MVRLVHAPARGAPAQAVSRRSSQQFTAITVRPEPIRPAARTCCRPRLLHLSEAAYGAHKEGDGVAGGQAGVLGVQARSTKLTSSFTAP